MRLRYFATLSAAIAATLVATACSTESPVAPQSTTTQAAPRAPSQSLLSTILPAPTAVKPLLRRNALASDITVTKTIGILGGTLTIPSAGVTVVVPPLAVSSPTNFSMTARAGTAVAYDFAPHGVHFAVPLVMTQNLTTMQGGAAILGSLQLGYYADPAHITSVTELLNINLDVLHTVGIAAIWHFSGYLFATGRASDGGDF
ncbi:MAG: hypothetical protein ABI085_05370 [Gemmatimonadaceae bacterium]